MLKTISNINSGEFTSLCNCHSTWPSQRFNYIDCIGDCSFFWWRLIVKLCITDDFTSPCWLPFSDCFMLLKISKSFNCWVCFFQCFKSSIWIKLIFILFILGLQVLSSSCSEDDLVEVTPFSQIFKGLSVWHDKFLIKFHII